MAALQQRAERDKERFDLGDRVSVMYITIWNRTHGIEVVK
jgi:hypothetical protein